MDEVLKFLSEHNRPFTANDIYQGLKQKIGKTMVVGVLTELVDENRVIEKNCGKQKIYCITQNCVVPLKDLSNNILQLERQSNNVALQLKEVEIQLESSTTQLKNIESVLTQQDVLQKKEIFEQEVESLQAELKTFEGKTVDTKKEAEVKKNYAKMLTEYRKRKRFCMDMVDAIFENYPKSKKSLLQDIGIEMDQDVNFEIKLK